MRVAEGGGMLSGACGGDGERLERGESGSEKSGAGTKDGMGRGLEEVGSVKSNGINELEEIKGGK